ncbi:MAG: precorrin-2 C(20)-methyltransferase [Anaeromyxobacteraceae bacterium]
MSAVLYGVGAGPGAPDLLTLRAVAVLRSVPVVAAPRPSDGEESLAWRIAREAVGEVPGQERLLLTFPMTRDAAVRRAAREAALATVAGHLAQGRSVAFVTEGDPLLYSTFLDLLAAAPRAGARVEVVPGVSSVTAVGAAARVPLADGEDAVAVLPAARALRDLARLVRDFETLLLFKAGRHLADLAGALAALGVAERAWVVSDASRPGERVTPLVARDAARAGYFTTVLVRTRAQEAA